MNQDAIDAATAAASAAKTSGATWATFAGSLSMIGGWVLSSQAAVLIGMLIGLAGWYYRHREYLMRKREHAALMRREGINVEEAGQ